jgi:septation ring formation regulator EzrA
LSKSGFPATKEDEEFMKDLQIIGDMLKSTISGAIDKFAHSYSTLTDAVKREIKDVIECKKDIKDFDERILDLKEQKRLAV